MAMVDYLKNQNMVHHRYIYQVVSKAMENLQHATSLASISLLDGAHITVCGDVHGQFYDLLNIFDLNGFPSKLEKSLLIPFREIKLRLLVDKAKHSELQWNYIHTVSTKGTNHLCCGLLGGRKSKGLVDEGDTVTSDFVMAMVDYLKNQNMVHHRYIYQVVSKAMENLQHATSLASISLLDGAHITVCGDVHGQSNPYLFNGDFVDRGAFSVEVIITLFAFKAMCPQAIYLARGNHESDGLNERYGFHREVYYKLGRDCVELFSRAFCFLPLAHVINDKIFVVHGGLFSQDGVTLSDIRGIYRFCQPPQEGLMCELLWSDPQTALGRAPNKRGCGISFGQDVTQKFLKENNLDLVVRSHEVKDKGFEVIHNGQLITVFSAPNYCDQFDNLGAYIMFTAPELIPSITTFKGVDHP
ncbi:hypothetical protein Bca52824_057625 [Brassica carinata]|uniref:protein-serine/threonine phosphatase n=1 Tax=Brassica carinata TaxID=52824 RepID=A0A8X7UCW6_BRACI|nr:hypothetical protein Bca52824_057625 [Brassica carinata]